MAEKGTGPAIDVWKHGFVYERFRIDCDQQAAFVGKLEPSNLQRRGHIEGGGYQRFKCARNDVVPKARVPREIGVILAQVLPDDIPEENRNYPDHTRVKVVAKFEKCERFSGKFSHRHRLRPQLEDTAAARP